jgi:hypothetical protein
MLNILKNNKNTLNVSNFNVNSINAKKQNAKIQTKLNLNEYKNIIHYPSSNNEWFNSVYSYNKSHIKPMVAIDVMLNNLFKSYFNMLQYKKKILYKRRSVNKKRYSANKVYVSRAEIKHTNTKILVILYIYNKYKSSIERYMKKLINLTIVKQYLVENKKEYLVFNIYRIILILKKRFFWFRKWDIAFFKISNNLLEYIVPNIKRKYLKSRKVSIYNIILIRKLFKLEQIFFYNAKLINFNKSKFSNILLNLKDIGLICFLKKIYNKNVEIKIVELKSIHLNSDVFSSAVAWKLRDRKNKAVRILRKAILQMVKIPDFHTLITFDDRMESINKNNVLNVIKQQIVSGVRFEAAGRLTRRLTALRAIFKYRYTGSLKNIRSSYNNKSSTILRGCLKSNAQYTIINSKTRNGAFGLKGWVSSH